MKQSGLLIALSLSVAGCGGGGTDLAELRAELVAAKASLAELRAGLAAATAEANEAKRVADSLGRSVDLLQMRSNMQAWDEVAYLTVGSQGYGVVKTNHMIPITVSIKDVTAFANGSRVVLTLGNMSAASLTGVSATVEYGRVEGDAPDNTTARRTSLNFPEVVRGGAWTDVRVVLEGLPPKELGFIRVRDVKLSGIRLQ